MSFKVRTIATAAIAVALVASVSACGGSASGSGEEIIAAPLSMTGPAGSVGLDIKQGAQLAIDTLNKKGGVGGKKLKLVVQDTAGEPAQAVQLVTSFAKDKNVLAILGPINAAEVGAVTNIAQSSKVVLFPPASSGAVPGVTDGKFNPWTFRLNQAIPLTVGPQMTKVLSMTGAKAVTILNYDDNAAYVDTADRWETAAKAAGATVQRLQFPSSTQDFSSIVTKISHSSSLIAIGALSATDASLTRAIRQAGIKAQLMGDASMLSSEVYSGSRGASEGAYAYSAFLPGQTAESKEFQSAFEAKYKKEPTTIDAYGYETVMLIAHAAGKNPTRESVREGLSKLKDYSGITGTISYDGSGDAHRTTIPLVKVGKDGAIEEAGEITPAESQ